MPRPNSLCACGQEHIVNRKRRLLAFVAAGHSVQHGVLFCADVERWPRLQEEQGVEGRHWKATKPTPMLFIQLG